MLAPSDMKGKAALVTGAASGLGRATALRLARAGADICAVDVNAAGLDETMRDLKALGVRAVPHVADLTVRANCAAAVAAAAKAFGRLDALCNVAGIMYIGHTTEMPAAMVEKIIAVNLSAPFYLIQAAMPHLLAVKGAVVNVTSQAAFIGQAYMAIYCATKAGLTHMTKALAMEYTHKPVRINAVAPGGMHTTMTATMTLPDDLDQQLFNRVMPLRGFVEVDDVAELVAFLASDAARGYHGACINVDRGATIG